MSYSTTDVSIAAFIKYKGYKELKFRRLGSRRTGEWTFEIDDDAVAELQLEYVNHDFAAFEGIRRGLSKQKY